MTIVHLLRHGEVHNPDGVLYGRLPGYHLSQRGARMAELVADAIGDRDITVIRSSPLERAQETAAPTARRLGLDVGLDDRLLESTNKFQGESFKKGYHKLLQPRLLKHMWNPFRPSWGEAYDEVAARMWAAVLEARIAADGHEALLVSHQLPIWVTRLRAEGRPFFHDPRKRQCTVCSLTSFTFDGERVVSVGYSEPAGHLIPLEDRNANFSSGGVGVDEGLPPH
ncbi:MAG TPA: histidine phosphatase family protein [Marmoricola sp.]|nr:histidine phosphatase family protein [Marmoricola sp.]